MYKKKSLFYLIFYLLTQYKYSFVIKDAVDGNILAVSVNVDAVVELEEMDSSEFKSQCPYVFEFLDHIETPNL